MLLDLPLDTLSKSILAISTCIPTYLFLRYVIVAPYGKHSDRSSYSFGPLINAKLGWFIFESPNLILAAWSYLHRDEALFNHANAALLSMFCIHYINRSVIYPLCMSRSSRPVPLAVAVSGWSYCMVNGYLQGQSLCQKEVYPEKYIKSPRFLVGATIFIIGLAINLHSDGILRALKSGGGITSTNNANAYRIPRGGFFELVSCANYFGEICEWAGYAVACNNLAALSFLAFTCSNLIPRALSHHEWYLQKFNDYPLQRRAIIPFIL